jgi:energy-coupling factor transporter transmembrane protein EcfT
MRRLIRIVLACALGLGAAYLFRLLADIARPCGGEGLSCAMIRVVGFVYTPVFAAVALFVFGIAELWKGHARALTAAMLLLLVPFLILFASFKFSDISVREFHDIREHDIDELLQIAIPIVLTLIVPWLVLTTTGRHAAGVKASA